MSVNQSRTNLTFFSLAIRSTSFASSLGILPSGGSMKKNKDFKDLAQSLSPVNQDWSCDGNSFQMLVTIENI